MFAQNWIKVKSRLAISTKSKLQCSIEDGEPFAIKSVVASPSVSSSLYFNYFLTLEQGLGNS